MDLTFLPAPYGDIVVALCELIAAASVLAALAKPLLGTPSEHDGPVRKFLFGVISALDVLAANTSKVTTRAKLAKAQEKVRDLGGEP